MKLISLNTWGGKVYKPLLKFVKEQSLDTDIFCFQEVFDSLVTKFSHGAKTDLYSDFTKNLKDFKGFYAPTFTGFDTLKKVDFDLAFGQATFVRKNIQVVSEDTVFIHGRFDYKPPKFMEGIEDAMDLPRNIHLLKVKLGKKEILIGNIHGYWIHGSKTDTSERIAQSKEVKKILDNYNGEKIICGDFNLSPDTKSLKMLEENMKNLIKEFDIKGTRTHHYKKTNERYADYILVSEGIKVDSFVVPDIVVSDHLPMILDFKL